MAAPAGAASAPPPPRSFADVLSNTKANSIPVRPPRKFKGMPAVSFTDQDIQILAQKFKFTLIGKFSKGRPSMQLIRKTFEQIGFGGHFSLGLIDQRHILINFDLKEDYQRCWLRKSWSIQGFIMNVFKWTPDFRPEVEVPIVPVWIAFEGLPAHLQDKSAVYSIANLIGAPLKVDASTLSTNRPSVARVCVELNVTKPLPQNVWIDNGSFGGFTQAVKYEYIPPYCLNCNKFGHSSKECRSSSVHRAAQETNQVPERTQAQIVEKPSIIAEPAAIVPPRKRWRPVAQVSILPPLSIDNGPTQSSDSNEKVPVQKENDNKQQDSDCLVSDQIKLIPDHPKILGTQLIDDQGLCTDSSQESIPGHYSDGDNPREDQIFSKELLESWKESNKCFSAKLREPDIKEFVTVTKKKQRARKAYSIQSPSVTTRLAAAAAAVLIIGIGILILVFKHKGGRRKQNDGEEWSMVSFQRLEFNKCEIFGGLKDENLIGNGGSGKVYRVITKKGQRVAVKSIRHERKQNHILEKQLEVEILGGIRHNNIVKLLCCVKGNTTKLVVYEYMDKQCLHKWLHGKKKGLTTQVLNWDTRLKIAMGATQGLCYMHHDCSPPIVHRDIKSSNILVDSDFNVKIADFGLAKMIASEGDPETASAVVGTFGYIAPEYSSTRKVDAKSDIYSFGVVLLELTTGREAVTGNEDMNLAQWARKHQREGNSAADALFTGLASLRLQARTIMPLSQTSSIRCCCDNSGSMWWSCSTSGTDSGDYTISSVTTNFSNSEPPAANWPEILEKCIGCDCPKLVLHRIGSNLY